MAGTHTHTQQTKIKNGMSPRILSFKIFFSKVKKKKTHFKQIKAGRIYLQQTHAKIN